MQEKKEIMQKMPIDHRWRWHRTYAIDIVFFKYILFVLRDEIMSEIAHLMFFGHRPFFFPFSLFCDDNYQSIPDMCQLANKQISFNCTVREIHEKILSLLFFLSFFFHCSIDQLLMRTYTLLLVVMLVMVYFFFCASTHVTSTMSC